MAAGSFLGSLLRGVDMPAYLRLFAPCSADKQALVAAAQRLKLMLSSVTVAASQRLCCPALVLLAMPAVCCRARPGACPPRLQLPTA